MRKLRLIITGGGTGGHIYPLIAVVSELRALAMQNNVDLRIKYLGSPGVFRSTLQMNKIEVIELPLAKIRRHRFSLLKNIVDIPKFIFGFIKSLWVTLWFMPNVLFSKGGPGSLEVVLASAFYFVPTIIHESDTIPGLSNKIGGWFARVVALSYPSAVKYFDKNAFYTGAPVRADLFQDQEKTQAFSKKFNGFLPDRPLILVIGGSQGAVRLNNLVINNLQTLLQFTQVLHQTGKDNYEALLPKANDIMRTVPIGLREGYLPVSYFKENIHLAYKAADLVISRSGSGSIFEIAALGRPSVLVPLPESAGDHQKYNAYEYAATGAAEVLEEKDIYLDIFVTIIKDLLSDTDKLAQMSAAAKTFYKPDAAKHIAETILRIAR